MHAPAQTQTPRFPSPVSVSFHFPAGKLSFVVAPVTQRESSAALLHPAFPLTLVAKERIAIHVAAVA